MNSGGYAPEQVGSGGIPGNDYASEEDRSKGMTSEGYAPGRDWSWRTSRLSPFGANAAFVLQECGGGSFKVGLYVNEQLGKQRFDMFDLFDAGMTSVADLKQNNVFGTGSDTLCHYGCVLIRSFRTVLRIRLFYIRIRIKHFDNIQIRIQKSQ